MGYSESNKTGNGGVWKFAFEAMNSTFEVFIEHGDGEYAGKAAGAAFAMSAGLEQKLSRFGTNSEITQINESMAGQEITLSLEVFECIEIAKAMWQETEGAFDPTVEPLMAEHYGERPDENAAVGMENIELNADEHSVKKLGEVRLDLGAIGKGFAADKMAEVLGEWGIERALVSGGGSSIVAMGASEGRQGWPVAVRDPRDGRVVRTVMLERASLSGSGIEKGSHIIDPKSRRAAGGKVCTWSRASSGARADALSTAMFVMSEGQIEEYFKKHRDEGGIVIDERGVREFGAGI